MFQAIKEINKQDSKKKYSLMENMNFKPKTTRESSNIFLQRSIH